MSRGTGCERSRSAGSRVANHCAGPWPVGTPVHRRSSGRPDGPVRTQARERACRQRAQRSNARSDAPGTDAAIQRCAHGRDRRCAIRPVSRRCPDRHVVVSVRPGEVAVSANGAVAQRLRRRIGRNRRAAGAWQSQHAPADPHGRPEGRALVRGDRLPLGTPVRPARGRPGVETRSGDAVPAVRIPPGRRTTVLQRRLAARVAPYYVTVDSNRWDTGSRGALRHRAGADIISDATPMDRFRCSLRQPLLLMADRQTTGGYAKLATIISADIGVAGQAAPGDRIQFQLCSRSDAVAALLVRSSRCLPSRRTRERFRERAGRGAGEGRVKQHEPLHGYTTFESAGGRLVRRDAVEREMSTSCAWPTTRRCLWPFLRGLNVHRRLWHPRPGPAPSWGRHWPPGRRSHRADAAATINGSCGGRSRTALPASRSGPALPERSAARFGNAHFGGRLISERSSVTLCSRSSVVSKSPSVKWVRLRSEPAPDHRRGAAVSGLRRVGGRTGCAADVAGARSHTANGRSRSTCRVQVVFQNPLPGTDVGAGRHSAWLARWSIARLKGTYLAGARVAHARELHRERWKCNCGRHPAAHRAVPERGEGQVRRGTREEIVYLGHQRRPAMSSCRYVNSPD